MNNVLRLFFSQSSSLHLLFFCVFFLVNNAFLLFLARLLYATIFENLTLVDVFKNLLDGTPYKLYCLGVYFLYIDVCYFSHLSVPLALTNYVLL